MLEPVALAPLVLIPDSYLVKVTAVAVETKRGVLVPAFAMVTVVPAVSWSTDNTSRREAGLPGRRGRLDWP